MVAFGGCGIVSLQHVVQDASPWSYCTLSELPISRADKVIVTPGNCAILGMYVFGGQRGKKVVIFTFPVR